MQDHPTGNITNTYVHNSGWREGLPIRVDDYANGTGVQLMRSSFTRWTQDDITLQHILNPRVTESKVTDWNAGALVRRTAVEYRLIPNTSVAEFGLVSASNILDGAGNVLKRSETDYNLASTYITRRIIGLPSETRAFGKNDATQSLELVSRVTYAYDEGNFSQEPNQTIAPTRHDTTGYGSSFIAGRGNLTSTTRHDVTGATASITSRVRYDIAGSPVAQLDPLDRKVAISYTDVYNDNENRNSFAYPTTVTDPAGNSSTVRYRYDIGANVRAQSPAPAGNTVGKITERFFDSIGRLEKDLVVNSGAYTRYEYPPNGIQSKVYSTIIDTNGNNTGDTADEVLAESWSDGAGRTLRSRTEHPGSIGGWAATLQEFDVLGRVKRTTVPTEVSVANPNDPNSWQPAGDDAARGFLWTHQKYDWMNRLTRKINTDGDANLPFNYSDVLISYNNCGCAGGLETTVQGEFVPRDDQPTENARRVMKSYADILGRTVKSEVYNWDGITVYSSTTNQFNGRDQVIRTRSFQGVAVLNNEHQTTTSTFDGHGRLKTRQVPEQGQGNVTSYTYLPDDQVESMTDARGAVTNHTYNSRGLLEQVSYSVPQGSTIPMVAPTSFVYDAAGNRSQMIDQTGTKSYTYDALSRLISETKQFNGQNSSPTQPFTISYTYHIGGELKSVTEPFGQRIDYTTDKLGRLSQVTSTPFTGPPPVPHPPYLLSNMSYYAFGPLKSMSFGSGATMNQSFNSRLQISEYKVRAVPWWAQTEPWSNTHAINMQYFYLPDGRIRYSKDIPYNNVDSQNDRGYKYDHAGRITSATTGAEARGQTEPNDNLRPYRQNFTYDVWGNVTRRDAWHWMAHEDTQHLYSNNRESSWSYDSDGRLTRSMRLVGSFTEQFDYAFDAAGSLVTNVSQTAPMCEDPGTTRTTWMWSDGDRQTAAKRVTASNSQVPSSVEYENFFIRSSVLDQVISEVSRDGTRWVSYAYAFGQVLTRQVYASASWWEHRDPSNAKYSSTRKDERGGTDSGGVMLDPAGSNVGWSSSEMECNTSFYDDWWTYHFGPARRSGCYRDGMEYNCGFLMRLLIGDSVAPAPQNNSVQVIYNGKKVLAHFQAFGDGYAGYVPTNGEYIGQGQITPIGGWQIPWGQAKIDLINLAQVNGLRVRGSAWHNAIELGRVLGRADFAVYKSLQDDSTRYKVSIEEK